MGIYDKSILAILANVGSDGISVRKLAMHVYNNSSSLFERPDFKDVHRYVQQYLIRNSKSPTALIESCDHRGLYRLNISHSADARQLLLNFTEESENKPTMPPTPQQDLSLSLFD